MGGGGVIIQRDEMRKAIGPGTANFAALPTGCQTALMAICATPCDQWTHAQTMYVASMFVVAVAGS